MTLSAIVRSEAEADIREAKDWYDGISSRLGQRFIAELNRVIALVCEYPEIFALAHKALRRALLQGFPYALYYRVDVESIVIFALFHQARDPDLIKQRL